MKPRRTIMPRPPPVRSWQGAQKIPKRSRPRSSTMRVSGKGGAARKRPSAAMPVAAGRSARSWPRGTVPAGSGRAEAPSAKNGLASSGS